MADGFRRPPPFIREGAPPSVIFFSPTTPLTRRHTRPRQSRPFPFPAAHLATPPSPTPPPPSRRCLPAAPSAPTHGPCDAPSPMVAVPVTVACVPRWHCDGSTASPPTSSRSLARDPLPSRRPAPTPTSSASSPPWTRSGQANRHAGEKSAPISLALLLSTPWNLYYKGSRRIPCRLMENGDPSRGG